jgi:hypothetical protein
MVGEEEADEQERGSCVEDVVGTRLINPDSLPERFEGGYVKRGGEEVRRGKVVDVERRLKVWLAAWERLAADA